jgi:hypothetical protein
LGAETFIKLTSDMAIFIVYLFYTIMRAQGALEYLIIMVAVLSVSAVVVSFLAGAFTSSSGGADLTKCKLATAQCKKDVTMGLTNTCDYCEDSCVDAQGNDIISGLPGCNDACLLCKQGKQITWGGEYAPSSELIGYWKLDENVGRNIYNSVGSGPAGILSGSVIGDFEGSMDDFILSCSGTPATSYAPGKVGVSGLKLWSEDNGAVCAIGEVLANMDVGRMLWFYGKGYVQAEVYDLDDEVISHVEEADGLCGAPISDSRIYTYCNEGEPYSDWTLFKLVSEKDTRPIFDGTNFLIPKVYLYSSESSGEENAGYYDFVTYTPVWVDGKYGTALKFSGRDMAPTNYFGPYLQEMTISVWFKILDWQTGAVVGRYTSFGGIGKGWMLYRETSWPVGEMGWNLRYATTTGTTAGVLPKYSGLVADTWYHAAVVVTPSGQYKTYLNKAPYFSGTAPTFLEWGGVDPLESMSVYIGSGGAYWFFTGLVDEVRLYSNALTDAQIANLP